jgi:hypothetical protein
MRENFFVLKMYDMNWNRCKLVFAAFRTAGLLIALLLLSSQSFAKSEIIYASHRSIMGDNDSKNDARRMCFLEAKRKVLEKAGTYIESHTNVRNYQLTKDEITTYTAALLKVDVVKENWQLVAESLAISITVKAVVETNYVEQQLSKIQKDTSAQQKIKNQQMQLRTLERKLADLQKQIASADVTKAAPLRKERNVVFEEIDELEAKKIKIQSKISTITADIMKYTDKGMTRKEVISLVGNPRSTGCNGNAYNYGYVWVVFRNEIAACFIYYDCFGTKGRCNCSYYLDYYPKECVAK